MKVVAFAGLVLLACAAVVSAEEVQGWKYPKTVTVFTVYNATTRASEPITVDAVSRGTWTKRSWNRTPRHAALVNFTDVDVLKTNAATAALVAPDNTAFVITFADNVRRPTPVTVQYTGFTVDGDEVTGWVFVKPMNSKMWPRPVGSPMPWPVHSPKPHPVHSPKPWDKDDKHNKP